VALPPTGTALAVHDARPWLIAAVTAGVLILAGWALAQRRLAALEGAVDSGRESEQKARESEQKARESEQEAREAQAEVTQQLRDSEAQRGRLARERDEGRTQLDQLARGWRSERDWNRELREQIGRLQHERGILADHSDVRQMVLELTMNLVEAEKGILLSDRETAEGKLKVVCHLGFESDPQESAIAQRFATEVVDRDATIREDDEARVDAEKRTAADEEVRNLLAISIYLADDFAGVIVCANREDGFERLDDDVLLAVGDHAGGAAELPPAR